MKQNPLLIQGQNFTSPIDKYQTTFNNKTAYPRLPC